jgi:hypothetical protein
MRDWGFSLQDITSHVSIWHGEADYMVFPAAAKYMASKLPNHALHMIPGTGHLRLISGHAEESVTLFVQCEQNALRPACPGPRTYVPSRGVNPCRIDHLVKEHHSFGPDEIKVLATAFYAALLELSLGRTDPAALLVAKRIMALAQGGERDPTRLREGAVKGI